MKKNGESEIYVPRNHTIPLFPELEQFVQGKIEGVLDTGSSRGIEIRGTQRQYLFARENYGKPRCPDVKITEHAPDDDYPAAWSDHRGIDEEEVWFYTPGGALLEAQYCGFSISGPEVWRDIFDHHLPGNDDENEIANFCGVFHLKQAGYFSPNMLSDDEMLDFDRLSNYLVSFDERDNTVIVCIGVDSCGSDVSEIVPEYGISNGAQYYTLRPYIGSR